MIKARITKSEADNEPWKLWNGFVETIARDPEQLTIDQRPAHFVFVYESEVQNGGHLQYFENNGSDHAANTIAALAQLGADCQRDLLEQANRMFSSRLRKNLSDAEHYAAAALEDEFGIFDAKFHECSP